MNEQQQPVTDDEQELWASINSEVAQIRWAELQRHYARGVVLLVGPDLDLVRVAMAVVGDAQDSVAEWTDNGAIRPADDSDAQRWHQADATLWAVVAAPWVLVQELACGPGASSCERDPA